MICLCSLKKKQLKSGSVYIFFLILTTCQCLNILILNVSEKHSFISSENWIQSNFYLLMAQNEKTKHISDIIPIQKYILNY